jgi:hypothetical protein
MQRMKFALTAILFVGTTSLALAQPAPPAPATQPSEPVPEPTTQPTTQPTTTPTTTPVVTETTGTQTLEESDTTGEVEAEKKKTRSAIGIGGRFRFVLVPGFVRKIFFDYSPSASAMVLGAELIRRRGNLDIVFGLEYWRVNADDSLILDKGDDPSMPDEAPDFVDFKSLGGIGADIQFTWHTRIAPMLDFRYGAGIGVVIPIGSVTQTDTECMPNTSADDLDDRSRCPDLPGTTVDASIPPILPLPTLMAGLRFAPVEQISINLELGVHFLFFGGLTFNYFF